MLSWLVLVSTILRNPQFNPKNISLDSHFQIFPPSPPPKKQTPRASEWRKNSRRPKLWTKWQSKHLWHFWWETLFNVFHIVCVFQLCSILKCSIRFHTGRIVWKSCFLLGGNKTSMKSCQVRSLVIYLAKLDEYFTNLDFPEIRGFPFLSDLSGEIGRVRSL